jgi:hypothetical protein
MKTISLVLILFLIPIHANSQESANNAVVAVTNMNVLYAGISNPIEIAVPGVTSDEVTATITNGTIKKTSIGWEVQPSSLSELVLTVLVNNKKVDEKVFRVKPIPVPVAVFGGISNGGISKDIALTTEVLEAELKDFLWDLKFEITGFTFLFSKDNYDYQLKSDGNKLTDKMKSYIADFEIGHHIIFKDIKAVGPDKKTRDLPPVILSIQ